MMIGKKSFNAKYAHFLNVDLDMSTAHTAITLRVVTSRVGVALGVQNLPLLPQPFAKTFGAETFAKLFYLTYRIDFLLQFGLLFNPECTFKK